MIVIVHQTVNMEDCSVAMVGGFKVGKKPLTISIVSENGFSLVSTGGHMVKGIWKLDPQWSSQVDLSKALLLFVSHYLIYVKS